MLCFSHHLKVLDRVVSPVLVDVVHNFIWTEESAQMFFHHEPVFHHVSLAIGVGMVGSEPSPVFAAPAIGDAALKVGVVRAPNVRALPRRFAFRRTELLSPLPGVCDVRSALPTVVGGSRAPSRRPIALPRAVFRGRLSPIFRVKRLVAVDAFKRQCGSLHDHIIACDERYCETASRRIQQSVLPLEVPA